MFARTPGGHQFPPSRDNKLRAQHYTPSHPSPLSSSPLRQSPSPLSPRHCNIPSAFDSMLSPTPTPTKPPSMIFSSRGSTRKECAFSKRPNKPNPLMHRNSEEGRETRRKLFLKKVKEEGKDRRWQRRGGDDEMMRTVFQLEEKREMERRRREAATEAAVEVEDMEMQMQMENWNVDFEVVRREEEELELLAKERERQNMGNGGGTPYGSDDEEYDDIFMEVIRDELRISSQQAEHQPLRSTDTEIDMMDMS